MNDDFDIREENISKDEKEFENALRPLRFDDFNGQSRTCASLLKLPNIVVSRSTIPCFTAPRGWAKPRSATS